MAHRKIAFPKLRKSLSAATTAFALVCAVGAADAALVTGRFDPEFGGYLPGIGYEGTATFNIDDACLALSTPPAGAFIYASYNCGNGGSGMSFLGAHVDFYNLGDHSAAGSVDFLGDAVDPFGWPTGASSVLGMFVQDNKVIGVQSKVIGPVASDLSGTPSFLLLFGMTDPIIGNDEDHYPGYDGDNDLDDQDPSVFQQTRLFAVTGNCSPTDLTDCVQSNIANTNYVPEPGSAALLLAALLAAGGLRRRVR